MNSINEMINEMIKAEEKTAQEASQKAKKLKLLQELSGELGISLSGVIVSPPNNPNVPNSVGDTIPVKRIDNNGFTDYDRTKSKKTVIHRTIENCLLHVRTTVGSQGDIQRYFVYPSAVGLKREPGHYNKYGIYIKAAAPTIKLSKENIQTDNSTMNKLLSLAPNVNLAPGNHKDTDKPVCSATLHVKNKNTNTSNIESIFLVSDIKLLKIDPILSVPLDHHILINDPELKSRRYSPANAKKNLEDYANRLGEIVHAINYPSFQWVNKDDSRSSSDRHYDFKQPNGLTEDIKTTSKYYGLTVNKSKIDNNKLADIFVGYRLEVHGDNLIALPQGTITSEKVIESLNDGKRPLHNDGGEYLIFKRNELEPSELK